MQENAEYQVSWNDSLYPSVISRVHRGTRKPQWAWTLGTPRLVNEAVYAIEIIKTEKGAIHLGVATEDAGLRGSKAPIQGLFFLCLFPDNFIYRIALLNIQT